MCPKLRVTPLSGSTQGNVRRPLELVSPALCLAAATTFAAALAFGTAAAGFVAWRRTIGLGFVGTLTGRLAAILRAAFGADRLELGLLVFGQQTLDLLVGLGVDRSDLGLGGFIQPETLGMAEDRARVGLASGAAGMGALASALVVGRNGGSGSCSQEEERCTED